MLGPEADREPGGGLVPRRGLGGGMRIPKESLLRLDILSVSFGEAENQVRKCWRAMCEVVSKCSSVEVSRLKE